MALSLSPVVPVLGAPSTGLDDDRPGNNVLALAPAPPVPPVKPHIAWDVRHDGVAGGDVKKASQHQPGDQLVAVLLVALAVVDNVLCYCTFFTMHNFSSGMHNIVDAQLALVPWMTPALLAFAILGTASFAAIVVLVECNSKPLFHEIMNVRIYCSALPCSVLCGGIVYYSEQTNWVPFTALITIMLFIFFWCVHMRLRWSYQLNTLSRTLLDISWFLAVLTGVFLGILFSLDRLDFITKSNELSCPFADNAKMPLYVAPLAAWFCSSWGLSEPEVVSRSPVNEGSPAQLTCSTTFTMAFGATLEAHAFECPDGCLRQYVGSGLTGCGIYSTDTPLCVAAIHSGILTDSGGAAVAYGRLGLPKFESCSRNSVVSEERHIMPSGSLVQFSAPDGGRRLAALQMFNADGTQVPLAFHFNNLRHTQEYFWLQSWQVVHSDADRVNPDRPWTRIEATVSMRIAGIELHDEKVRLGRPEDHVRPRTTNLEEAALTPSASQSTSTCRLEDLGAVCPGVGVETVLLDFCRPEASACAAA